MCFLSFYDIRGQKDFINVGEMPQIFTLSGNCFTANFSELVQNFNKSI